MSKDGTFVEDKTAIKLIHEITHGVSAATTGVPVGDPDPDAGDAQFNQPNFDMRGAIVDQQNIVAQEMGWSNNSYHYQQASYYVNLDLDALQSNGFTPGENFTEGNQIDEFRLAEYTGSEIHMEGRGNSKNLIIGSLGNDKIFSGSGDDYIYGGKGDDYISPGGGSDVIWGGNINSDLGSSDGIDTVDYSSGSSPIKINYDGTGGHASLTVDDGMGGTDTLHSIESIIGTKSRDKFNIEGSIAAGTDLTIDAQGGQSGLADIISGKAASAGLNIHIADDGIGSIADASTGGTINLENFDTDIIGSEDSDQITDMSDGAKHIDALAGDNFIQVGNANTQVNTGSGQDLIYTGSGNDVINAGGGDSDWIESGSGADYINDDGYSTEFGHIDAGDGNDIISAKGSFQTDIYGGKGNDYIDVSGGSWSDTIYFQQGDGHDSVKLSDFDVFQPRNNLLNVDLSDFDPSDCSIIWDAKATAIENRPNDDFYSIVVSGPMTILNNATGDSIYFENFNGLGYGDDSQPGGIAWSTLWLPQVNFYFQGGVPPRLDTSRGGNIDVTIADVSAYNVAKVSYAADVAQDIGQTAGTSGNDILYGGSAGGQINAGAGDDLIYGSHGDYTVDGGDGNDTFDVFGSLSSFTVGRIGDDLVLTDSTGLLGKATLRNIENVEFDVSGETVTAQQLVGMSATDGNDNLVGTPWDDRLSGGAGDDVITGGQGNDTLIGGQGNDTYVWSPGDGDDLIVFEQPGDGADTLQFGPGISSADLRAQLSSDGYSIILSVSGSSGSITLDQAYWDDSSEGVQTVKFSDGSVLNKSDLIQMIYDGLSTEGDDTIVVKDVGGNINSGLGNDNITSGAGDDHIFTSDGDDYIVGSAGNDTVDGGNGVDTFEIRGSRGDGYSFERQEDGSVLVSGLDLHTILSNVEQIYFYYDGETSNLDDLVDPPSSSGENTPAATASRHSSVSLHAAQMTQAMVQQHDAGGSVHSISEPSHVHWNAPLAAGAIRAHTNS